LDDASIARSADTAGSIAGCASRRAFHDVRGLAIAARQERLGQRHPRCPNAGRRSTTVRASCSASSALPCASKTSARRPRTRIAAIV